MDRCLTQAAPPAQSEDFSQTGLLAAELIAACSRSWPMRVSKCSLHESREGEREGMEAARVVLLGFSVVLFVAMWSGDQPSRKTLPDMRADTNQVVEALRVAWGEEPESQCSTESEAVITETLPEEWLRHLPYGVAPGEYLFVETTGRAQRLRLTASWLQTWGQDPSVRGEPLYTLTTGTNRAYLIRLSPGDTPARIADAGRSPTH